MLKTLALAAACVFALVVQSHAAPFDWSARADRGVLNFDPTLLPHVRRGFALSRAGLGRMKIAFVGDSVTEGMGAGRDPGGIADMRQRSVVAYMARFLRQGGVAASDDGFFGAGGTGSLLTDARVTFGPGWRAYPWSPPPGRAGACRDGVTAGGPLVHDDAGDAPLTVAPSDEVDTFEVYSVDRGHGVMDLVLDGAPAATVTAGDSGALVKTTVAATPGRHRLEVRRRSGDVVIAGVDAFDAAASPVTLMNMGWSGSKASDWTADASPSGPLAALRAYAPDLTLIDLGFNDEGARDLTWLGFSHDMQAIIAAAQASGDVVLVYHHGAHVPLTWDVYETLSALDGLPLVDLSARMVSFAQMHALGVMFDQTHLLPVGYAMEARMIADLLLRL